MGPEDVELFRFQVQVSLEHLLRPLLEVEEGEIEPLTLAQILGLGRFVQGLQEPAPRGRTESLAAPLSPRGNTRPYLRPPNMPPSTPRTICLPNWEPTLRAALLAMASNTESRRRAALGAFPRGIPSSLGWGGVASASFCSAASVAAEAAATRTCQHLVSRLIVDGVLVLVHHRVLVPRGGEGALFGRPESGAGRKNEEAVHHDGGALLVE